MRNCGPATRRGRSPYPGQGDRIARGPVALAAGTKPQGLVKAFGQLHVGADSVIVGAHRVRWRYRQRRVVWGPVVAEGDVRIVEGREIEAGWPAPVVGEGVEIAAPA